MQVGHFMTEMVFKALSTATPDNIIAGSGGTPAQTNIFYGRRRNGSPWHTMIIRGGGMGAGSRRDGHHCAIFPANGANTPVEIFESDTPLMVVSRELVRDTGGPGQQRGGLGRKFVIRVPDDDFGPQSPTTIAVQAGRFRYPPEGIFGGKPGRRARFLKNGAPMDSGGLTFCDPGDEVAFYSAGGGGYGSPLARDPEAVAQDVKNGYVSIEAAARDYGVVIRPEDLSVDLPATRQRRPPAAEPDRETDAVSDASQAATSS
jgi:N-methylhydantoinase B